VPRPERARARSGLSVVRAKGTVSEEVQLERNAVGCIYSVSCCGCFVFVDESAEEVAPADLGD
jgi:hypothetical protein